MNKLKRALKTSVDAVKLILKYSRSQFIVNAIILILVGVVAPVQALLFKGIVDIVSSGQDNYQTILILIITHFILAISFAILQPISSYLQSYIQDKIQYHLRVEIASHAADLDMEFFEMPGNYDNLNKARQDIAYRPMMISQAIINIIQSSVTTVAFISSVVIFKPILGIALIISSIPVFISVVKSGNESYAINDFMTPRGRRAAYTEHLLTSDHTAKEIRIFNLKDKLLESLKGNFKILFAKKNSVNMKRSVRLITSSSIGTIFEYLSIGFVLYKVIISEATLGDFILVYTAVAGVRQGLTSIFENAGAVYENGLFFDDLRNFLSYNPLIKKPLKPVDIPQSFPISLNFENVTFAYPGSSSNVLTDLSFKLAAGTSTALVGINGAGKSTIVKLINRLYDPNKGRITLNGIDIRSFDPEKYRMLISNILQDFNKYQLTVTENITIGRFGDPPDEKRLNKAAASAKVLEIVENLPEGWNTSLGRQFNMQGQDLSGGQWQRIALARALYRDAPILILDEPSSSLDAETEFDIFNQYEEMIFNKTTLLISHQLNTVKLADLIIVIEGGIILEEGSHLDLIELEGRYYELFKMQADKYKEKD